VASGYGIISVNFHFSLYIGKSKFGQS